MTSNPTIELNQLVLLPGQRVLLQNVSWSKFEEILLELGENRAAKLAYDQGMLEIMLPLPEHEYFNDAIGDLVKDLAEELAIEYECFGSTTWRRQERMGGAEPDNCFYIQNLPAIRGRLDIDQNNSQFAIRNSQLVIKRVQAPTEIEETVVFNQWWVQAPTDSNCELRTANCELIVDLASDPPPDLVVEIDITSKSLARLPIYARLGVPEVWRYDQKQLRIYQLSNGKYVETETSLAFPEFSVKSIPDFIRQNLVAGRNALRQSFRRWVRQQIQKHE